MKVSLLFLALLLIWSHSGLAQVGANTQPFQLQCLDVRNEKINLDGIPDEDFWQLAEVAGNFINSDPTPGVPLSSPVEVRTAYDNEGLYIAVRAYVSAAELKKELSGRDDYQHTDFFLVMIDTYQSGSTGFQFGVSPRNVQFDAQLNGAEEDKTWDAVWESRTALADDHWSAEIKLPYSALRFPKKDAQKWNINFIYSKRSSREKAAWRPVNVLEEGLVQQAGLLTGVNNIRTPLRLTLLPYLTTYYSIAKSKPWDITGGLDLKYGLSDAYTLDMTLIPDFGQVTFDDRINNLTAFEVEYEERRPFFTEGLELFNRANLFYSRRIGANQAQLINAFKISGRNKKGFALGVLNAVEARSYTTVLDTVTQQIIKIEQTPPANFNVLVFDQILPNNSYISLINANTLRGGKARDANNTGVDFYLRNKAQTWFVGGDGAYARVFTPGADKGGYRYHLALGKNSGKFTYSAEYFEVDRNYDPSDLGYLYYFNNREMSLRLNYTDLRAKNNLIKRTYTLNNWYSRIIRPDDFFAANISLETFYLYRSFFGWFNSVNVRPWGIKDYFETRRVGFDRYVRIPANWTLSSLISSDYRKPLAIDLRVEYGHFDSKDWRTFSATLEPRIRFNDFISLFGAVEWVRNNNETGFYFDNKTRNYSYLAPDDLVFSTRNVHNIVVAMTPHIKINNNMNISIRFRNYWSQVDLKRLFVIDVNGMPGKEVAFETTDDIRYNISYPNIEMRFNWRYSSGSDLVLAWLSGANEYFPGRLPYWDSYGNFFGRNATNTLSLRLTYYLDYYRMKKLFNKEGV